MSTIRVKVTVAPVIKDVEKNDYLEAWETKCEEEGLEEGEEIPDEFAVERFTEDLNDGTTSLDDICDDASIEVEQV